MNKRKGNGNAHPYRKDSLEIRRNRWAIDVDKKRNGNVEGLRIGIDNWRKVNHPNSKWRKGMVKVTMLVKFAIPPMWTIYG